MTRLTRHHPDHILDTARGLVLERGVRAATVDAIAQRSGAPIGSLYHRFRSRGRLLAQLWVRAVRRSQAAFLTATGNPDADQAAVDACLSIYDFVRQYPDDAKLLASFRREDLLRDARAPALQRELKELNRPLEEAIARLATRLFQRATASAVEQTILAVVDLPMGLLRRYLMSGKEPPPWLRKQLEALVRTAIRTARNAT
jgi:AcrR family transcriptional regulator